jgi:hypothetical protein
MYQSFPVNLTEAQIKKLVKGQTVQLAASQLKGGRMQILVHPLTHKKMYKAAMKGTGCRISMGDEECRGSGFWDKLKAFGKKIVDSPIYQSLVKPLVRGAVDIGAKAIAPRLGNFAAPLKEKLDEFGSKTGAFGYYGAHSPAPRGGRMPVEYGLYTRPIGRGGRGGRGKAKKRGKGQGGRIMNALEAGSFLPA